MGGDAHETLKGEQESEREGKPIRTQNQQVATAGTRSPVLLESSGNGAGYMP